MIKEIKQLHLIKSANNRNVLHSDVHANFDR